MKPRKLVMAFALIGSVSIFLQYDFQSSPTCMKRICCISEIYVLLVSTVGRAGPSQRLALHDLPAVQSCLAVRLAWL